MKSTAYGITSSTPAALLAFARSDRWKALPFLVLMLTSSLPLNYTLEESRTMTVADVADRTQAAVASGNSMSSIGYVLFLVGLYSLAGWMLLKKPKPAALIAARQWPLLLLLLFAGASALWSHNPDKVIVNIVHNFGVLFLALGAALRYRHDPWLFPKHLGYVLGLNMVLHIGAVLMMPAYAIDWQDRWHGLAVSPNTLGALALTTLWANAAILICVKSDKDKYHAHLIFSGLAVLALFGTNSVTSILVSICTVALIYLFNKFKKMRLGPNFYVGAAIVLLIAASMSQMVGRAMDLGGLLEMLGRDANLTGRASIWEQAYKAISLEPFLGWSFDDHAYLIASTNLPYASYHNGFLDLMVCGGGVAIIFLLMLFIRWISEFTRSSRLASQITPYSASFAIAYLLHNMAESSLLAPRSQLWQIFLVLILLSACRNHRADSGKQIDGERLTALPLQIGPITKLE